jgi:hypothetical protein
MGGGCEKHLFTHTRERFAQSVAYRCFSARAHDRYDHIPAPLFP